MVKTNEVGARLVEISGEFVRQDKGFFPTVSKGATGIKILDELIDAIGKALALRVYAYALLTVDELVDGGKVEDDADPVEVAVRYTFGAIRRIKKQSGESYEKILDTLEDRQGNTRHIDDTLMMVRASVEIESKEIDQGEEVEKVVTVVSALMEHWRKLSPAGARWTKKAYRDMVKGREIAQDHRDMLARHYTPKGVKVGEYLELVARYGQAM